MMFFDVTIWPLGNDLVNVSEMVLFSCFHTAKKLVSFVSLCSVLMPSDPPVVLGMALAGEEEQLDWSRSQRAWILLSGTYLTSGCLVIFLHQPLSLCALELGHREGNFLH